MAPPMSRASYRTLNMHAKFRGGWISFEGLGIETDVARMDDRGCKYTSKGVARRFQPAFVLCPGGSFIGYVHIHSQ